MIDTRNFSEHEFAQLPAILRVILTTDGTVSTLLKQWFLEDILVEVLAQKETIVDEPMGSTPSRVLEREVVLRSKISQRELLRAHSYIYLDNIPHQLMLSIHNHPQGIGGALNETCAERLRQVTGYGVVTGENAVWREYKVLMQGLQLMKIREIFPIDVYAH